MVKLAFMLIDGKKNLLLSLMLITWLASGNVARADDCDEARKLYNEGLALSDNSAMEASYYQRAIELCPNYFEARNKLGKVYKSWGEYELAIKEFEEASRSPSFVEPRYNLGEIYRMQGRYDLASEAFTEAIKMEPDFRRAQNQLKYVKKRLGQYDLVFEPPQFEPITTAIFTRIPGMTLPKTSCLLDFQYRQWSQESTVTVEDPRALDAYLRKVDVRVSILGIRYGLTNNLTIGLIPKFFSRRADVPISFRGEEARGPVTGGIDADLKVTGFGDTVFLTKYRLWGKRKTHLSVFHLLSIPTGDDDAKDEDQGVERRIPLGSGSYDFTPGIAFTTVKEPFTIHADISYLLQRDTRLRQGGDEFHCDLALVLPRFHNIAPVLELNYRWADAAESQQLFQTNFQPGFGGPGPTGEPETHETTVKEKGGHTVFVSMGLQYSFTKGFKAELGAQYSIIKPDDTWVEDAILHVGLTKYFF
jgi:hypothetical protein